VTKYVLVVKNSLIDHDTLQKIINEVRSEKSSAMAVEAWKVLSAFDFPKYSYNSTRKTWEAASGERCLHSAAKDKSDLFRNRWLLTNQRLRRHATNDCKVLTHVSNGFTLNFACSWYRLNRLLGVQVAKEYLGR